MFDGKVRDEGHVGLARRLRATQRYRRLEADQIAADPVHPKQEAFPLEPHSRVGMAARSFSPNNHIFGPLPPPGAEAEGASRRSTLPFVGPLQCA